MFRGVTLSSILALGVALAGCTGMVAGTSTGSGSSVAPGATVGDGSGGQGTGTGTGASGPGTGTGPGTGAGASGPGTTPGVVNPGLSAMHRLNSAEYNASVLDALGTTLQPATENWRGGEIDGFDNIASVLGVDDTQVGLYVDAAEAISKDVFANAAARAKIVTCATTDNMTCVKSIIAATGLRVFRRPLTDAEQTTYAKVYTASRAQMLDHNGALQDVLWSLLSSAEFLYRMEFDNGVKTQHLISGYELASRLSYFLWSSGPDDALLASADTLNTDAVIGTSVTRMLADPKSARLVQNFAGQWLGARKALAHPVAADIYPTWNADIATAASNEIYSYFDEFLRKDRPWTDFLTADFNFVNAGLAGFYGIPNITGTAPQRVEYAGDKRAGFLSLVGFLAVSSVDRRSSPTLRGKWMLVNLLCSPPPSPPPGIPPLATGKATDTGSVRAVLEAHRAAPACSACHSVMDPFGLALEQYDGVGKFRTAYADGTAIDPSTSLPAGGAYPMGVAFSGLDGAASTVNANPKFKECIAEKLYTYGLGRSLTADDQTNTQAIATDWETTGALSISRLLNRLALSEPFRYRNPGSAQ
jgi:hypothetical protein